MSDIVWAPQPKQRVFMSRPEYECLYGGAAGGGKSEALVMEALRQVSIPYYRAILVRRTFPQMEELIEKSLKYYKPAFPGAKYNDSKHFWRFPSGAKVMFGSMPHEKDKYNFQGKPYDFIGVDELTQFEASMYEYLMSRNRPNGPGTRVYIRGTANPGGVGHGWVKARFISPAPPLTPMTEDVKVRQPDGSTMELARTRVFVPATVFDNEELMRNDPSYVATLSLMSEAERNALLYGDWDSFEGQVFREWRNDPAHYEDRRWTHVVEPFMPPKHWRCWRGFDFGYARPFSVGWYVADEDGRLYRIREYYGCTGKPNEGIKINPYEIAAAIRQIEEGDELLKGRDIVGVADPSIYDESRGESIAAMMMREPNFVYWHPGDNARIAGKMQYHYRLAFDEGGLPMFQCFSTCKEFIRTIPALVYDEKHVEDIDTETEDHIYDECRYVLMDNPISPPVLEIRKAPQYDPLSPEPIHYDKYDTVRRYY